MGNVYLCYGPPGAGKTTWAKQILALSKGTIKRVGKDDICLMLNNNWNINADWKLIEDVRNAAITTALTNGYSVIVDETFLPDYAFRQFMEALGNHRDLDRVYLIPFTHIPISDALVNNQKRERKVPDEQIRAYYEMIERNKQSGHYRNMVEQIAKFNGD